MLRILQLNLRKHADKDEGADVGECHEFDCEGAHFVRSNAPAERIENITAGFIIFREMFTILVEKYTHRIQLYSNFVSGMHYFCNVFHKKNFYSLVRRNCLRRVICSPCAFYEVFIHALINI